MDKDDHNHCSTLIIRGHSNDMSALLVTAVYCSGTSSAEEESVFWFKES